MKNLVTVSRHEGVALVALNNPPVNALSHAVRVALLGALKELFVATDVEAIVIACEGRTFIAGADIREFGKPPLAPDLPELVEFLDTAPQLTISAIHGTALGGGLELALSCHVRLATASAKLGLPEVTLGILPGAGGTQRLPRIVGVQRALDMIVSGVPVSAAEAQRLGVIDEIIGEDVKGSALVVARRMLAEKRPHRRASTLSATVDDPNLFAEYERGIAQRCRGFLAPFRCIEAVRAAVELPFDQGLERERALFRELMASPESKAQRHLFFGEREVAKVPGLADDTATRPMKSVAVFGSGALASDVAKCFADARIAVVPEAGEPSDDEAKRADLLIEVAAEDLEQKRAVLARLGAIAKPGAILASTTSSLDLDALAKATNRPADVVGMHFASPIARVRLLEAVRGTETADDAYATVIKLARSLGKLAVPVRGPVAHRLLSRCAREVALLRAEGTSSEAIDRSLSEFGFGSTFWAQLSALSERHSLARPVGTRDVTPEEIRERCVFSVVDEAARLLEAGAVARPLDVDMMWVHGYGFPVYRGGPLFFADQVGLEHVHGRILRYREQLGEEYWTPAPLIERLARDSKSFYGQP